MAWIGRPPETLESNGRRPSWLRRAVVILLAAVAVALFLALGPYRPDEGTGEKAAGPPPLPPTATSSPTYSGERVANRTRPKTSVSSGKAAMQVTFPDGAKAKITYPVRLQLAEMGAKPYATALVGDQVSILYVMPGGEAGLPGTRLRTFPGPGEEPGEGTVSLWRPSPDIPITKMGYEIDSGYVMVFRFGDWHLMAFDPLAHPLTFEARQQLAKNLHGRTTEDGFLTLRATGPVRLGRQGDLSQARPLGPQLRFGTGDRMLWVGPDRKCEVAGELMTFRSVCRDGFKLMVAGNSDFVDEVLRDVKVTGE